MKHFCVGAWVGAWVGVRVCEMCVWVGGIGGPIPPETSKLTGWQSGLVYFAFAEVVEKLREAGASVLLTSISSSAAAFKAALPAEVQSLVLEAGRLKPAA